MNKPPFRRKVNEKTAISTKINEKIKIPVKINEKTRKNQCKINANLEREKNTSKHAKTWIWEGLGLNLGGVWDALGRLLAALGRLLLIFLTF